MVEYTRRVKDFNESNDVIGSKKEDPAKLQKKKDDLWFSIIKKFEVNKIEEFEKIEVPNFNKPVDKNYLSFIQRQHFCEFIPTREAFKKVKHVRTI